MEKHIVIVSEYTATKIRKNNVRVELFYIFTG